MEDYKTDLEEIKAKYELLKLKYKLPPWKELDEDFDVSKSFIGESELILKDIRRKMNEKLASSLHLFETFMNPQAAPLFIVNVLKNLEKKDWENIKEIYNEIAKIQFPQILADTIYSEDKEVELILEISNLWSRQKIKIAEILKILDKSSINTLDLKNKSYFG
jgi:Glu-tRNA(Gln) amidotransferase subunit E-like FAD-binding protein